MDYKSDIDCEIIVEALKNRIKKSKTPYKDTILTTVDYLQAIENSTTMCAKYLSILVDKESNDLATNIVQFGNKSVLDTNGVLAVICNFIVKETINELQSNNLDVLKNMFFNAYFKELANMLTPVVDEVRENLDISKSELNYIVLNFKTLYIKESKKIFESIVNVINNLNQCTVLSRNLIDDLYNNYITIKGESM